MAEASEAGLEVGTIYEDCGYHPVLVACRVTSTDDAGQRPLPPAWAS